MKAFIACASALLLTSVLAGCTTAESGGAGIDVTRMHLGQPIARGTIAVETFAVPNAGGPEFQYYADAVEAQLTRLGWTVVKAPGQSEQVALVGFEQVAFEAPPREGPVSVGVGVGVGFNLGGRKSGPAVTTTLQVRIKRRSDGTVFWEGRGTSTARTDRPEGQTPALAPRLAEAVFRDFPGESGRTIRVR